MNTYENPTIEVVNASEDVIIASDGVQSPYEEVPPQWEW